MRLLAAVLGVASALWAGAAHATGSFECTGVEAPDVLASVLVSRMADGMVVPLGAEFSIAGDTYATEAPDGTEPSVEATFLFPAHQYGDRHSVIVEYADEEATGILVSLRLVRGAEGDGYALAGVLSVRDVGPWAVTCLEG